VKLGRGIRGLFTEEAIPAGSFIGEYKGKIITDQQAEMKTRGTNYLFDVKGANGRVLHVIDAANASKSSFLRYVNAANTEDQQNARYVQRSRRIYLKATRAIPPRAEIIAWYGSDTSRVITQR
jgi:SET domain-containing protein